MNAETLAKLLGVSVSSSYELMHEADFPVLKVGSRIVVPKEEFIQWVERHTKGGEYGWAIAKSPILSRILFLCPMKFSFSVSALVSWRSMPSCVTAKTARHISAGPATKRLAKRRAWRKTRLPNTFLPWTQGPNLHRTHYRHHQSGRKAKWQPALYRLPVPRCFGGAPSAAVGAAGTGNRPRPTPVRCMTPCFAFWGPL